MRSWLPHKGGIPLALRHFQNALLKEGWWWFIGPFLISRLDTSLQVQKSNLVDEISPCPADGVASNVHCCNDIRHNDDLCPVVRTAGGTRS